MNAPAGAQPSRQTPIAYRLSGVQLEGGWIVGELLSPDDDATGGLASVQYVVSRAKEKAFLKVLDFAATQRYENPHEASSRMMRAFAFEVSLLNACRGKDRVVRIIADGQYFPIPDEPSFFVPYLIFELADSDVRAYLRDHEIDVAWCLRSAHELAVGLSQLHRAGIFHQDLKASNALYFKEQGCKVGDMGSACSVESDLNKDAGFAGSWNYAAPEIWYGVAVDDFTRQSGDLFLLGSLFVYMFAQVSMRSLLQLHLDEVHRPRPHGRWSGTYEDALPYLQHSFSAALLDVRNALPEAPGDYDYRDDLTRLIAKLCNPDLRQRGFNLPDGSKTLDLERGITDLKLMAEKVARATL